MRLREYQQRAIDQLYDWFRNNGAGHPVLNMPGGSGKSVVIGSLVKDALTSWPNTRVLMLVHSQELIAQNADKLRQIWPNAPLGVYSAALGKRQIGEPITYAGIGSIGKKAHLLGHIDLCLVDEVHAVSSKETGLYRKLLADLLAINPAMRIVGLSASPYRLGHGMINQGEDAIFSDILEPVTIEELVHKKHLVPLRSKLTSHKLEADGLHKRGGEFVAAEMEEKYNTDDHNQAIVMEVIDKAKDRNHWLIFCSGVKHSNDMAQCFNDFGISAASLTGSAGKTERAQIIADFESGKTKALCSVGILTTGYDFPALDCIAFLRSTMSPGLYLQMAVRGMRTFDGKDDCLVLDFAGVVQAHGPITAIKPPKAKGKAGGEAPVKICENCDEIVHISVMKCPTCGHEFPAHEKPKPFLRNDDIMGIENQEMIVSDWNWRKHTSRTKGTDMLAVTYYGSMSDRPVTEYVTIGYEGWAGQKALRTLSEIASQSGAKIIDSDDFEEVADGMNEGRKPHAIEYRQDGKFFRVVSRSWAMQEA